MRVSLGHIDEYDDDTADFALQLGLSSVQLHDPSNLSSTDGYWTVEELTALRERCESRGLRLEGLENVPVRHFYDVQQGGPDRDEQLENFVTTIRNMAAAGIGLLGYNFLAAYVWRTDMAARGRGGARVTAFDLDLVGDGNALARYKLTPQEPIRHGLTAERLWENYAYFLDVALPVAESVGVRLALHPDDPPVDVELGGVARIFTSPQSLQRAHDMSAGSPAWGLNLCLGTVSEMEGQRSVDEVIDFFGPRGRIFYVHFRDVQGTVPRFQECFLGEGNYDPAAVVRRLHAVGFDGFLIDDHVPAMLGDADTWRDTSSAAYCSHGRAHAVGYLQGMLSALEPRSPTTTATSTPPDCAATSHPQ